MNTTINPKKACITLLATVLLLDFSGSMYGQLVYPGGGSGCYTKTLPAGPYALVNPNPIMNQEIYYSPPCLNRWFYKTKPKVVAGFTKPTATNEWWSAHMWNYETDSLSQPYDVTAYGTLMYFEPGWKIAPYGMANHAHPLSFGGRAYGLDLSSQNGTYITPDTKTVGFNQSMHLNIGIAGMLVPDTIGTQVKDYGDWTVDILWDDKKGNSLDVTSGHGLPFIYCKKTGGDVNMRYTGTLVNWAQTTQSLGITINDGSGSGDHYYGIFYPAGTIVSGINSMNSINPPSIFITQDENQTINTPYVPANASRPAFVLQLPGGKNYFSVAVLPDTTQATFQLYQEHAFAFVTGSQVSWNYNQATADVTSTFTLSTQAMEGAETQAIQALYRHQYLNSSNVNTTYTYNSPRGIMQVMVGNTFSTVMKHEGLIPNLPWAGTYDSLYIYNLFNTLMTQTSLFWENYYFSDSYGHALNLGRYADLIPIAKQVGHTVAFNAILDSVRLQLENWFTAAPVGVKNYKIFYYDTIWNTVVPYPAGYAANTQLNDHHFHYGYFIKAAAMVARYVPGWATQWGPMVEMLIKDVANWDRTDNSFPFLRFFDPYAGHSWASGHANFLDGNNQESATESVNFATAVALWGANTNNTTFRDLGIFLATNEIAAIQQYWWNKDGVSNPPAFTHQTISLLWGDKQEMRTWFPPGDPRHCHGIDWLPFTGASLFMGYDVNLVNSNYNELLVEEPLLSTTPVPNTPFLYPGKDWRDLGAMYISTSNPATGIAIENLLKAENVPMNYAGAMYPFADYEGTSWQMIHHWIHTFDSLGTVDLTTADYALTNVFVKNNCKHYVIYNPPGNPARTVHFSDGQSFTVAADTLQVFYWCPISLPVRLISFTGQIDGNTTLLNWKTASEINVNNFVVERSSDGIHFTNIGTVYAKGGVNQNSTYSFIDMNPMYGINYYHLKIMDKDGKYTYSTIVSVNFGDTNLVSLYPNPADDILYISVSGSDDYIVSIYDNVGQEVITQQDPKKITISNLASGIYMVKIIVENKPVVIKKLIVH
ncbi:MAG TPA: glycosyl hydrolase [Cytophagaceae bacterium]|jgi:endoglucanase Acf2|nr:glycosyl hydrolase [Cytophagaceae bacterium]